jgi:hypothetical protein
MKRVAWLSFLAVLTAIGCAAEQRAPVPTDPGPQVVEIVARGLEFDAPDRVAPGWTTLRLTNESPMVHFALLERLPAGIGVREQQEQVAPVFQEGMNLLAAGDVEAAQAKFAELPAWFGEIVFLGGPGLVAGGLSSTATMDLEPGTYLIECYVKTEGIFHSYDPSPTSYGMVHELTVAGERHPASEPRPDVAITLSSGSGIEIDGAPRAGANVVAVHFSDQAPHENFVGHDVHVARLDDDTDIDALARWMDWTRRGGLETPAPVEFVGGLNEMPAGTTGYFTVELEPGRYAWVAEVPGPADKGMLKTFVVAAPGGSP